MELEKVIDVCLRLARVFAELNQISPISSITGGERAYRQCNILCNAVGDINEQVINTMAD